MLFSKRQIQTAHIALTLGFSDVSHAFKRSKLGPFWITISTAVNTLALGLVFGLIFKADLKSYLPFLCSGLIVWGFVSSTISESCLAFIAAERLIRQSNISPFAFIFRVITRNIVNLGLNLMTLPVLFIIFSREAPAVTWLALLGAIMTTLNLSWIAYLLALFSARFRDLPSFITSGLTVLFYGSAVIWRPDDLPRAWSGVILDFNPMYHIIQVIRNPLIGFPATLLDWSWSICLLFFGWLVVYIAHKKLQHKIPFWV